ncbi:MAG TPA: serine/threonine-protein kinase, partial [Pyrinomonadaceae bacterium]
VWLAEKQSSIITTRFALKLSRDDDVDLEAFKREAAIWAQASGHPNVLPIIEADIYDEQVVIVSEYVPDGSLAAWVRESGGRAPSVEAACQMIDGVLAGLAHLHERRIIHRDLKPDNILLQRGTPRLTDFGISRLLRSGSYSTNVSGTLAYMAPESFEGKRNERTDIWAVGVIFYQLLSGRLPYDQADTASIVGAITRFDPPPLPQSVPEVLREIVGKALERDPSRRYASAAEMRQNLREAGHQIWLGEKRTVVDSPARPPVQDQTRKDQPSPASGPRIPEAQPEQPGVTAPTVVPVKGKSRTPVWVIGAVGALLLGVFLMGVYQSSGSDSSRQTTQVAQSPAAAAPVAAPEATKEAVINISGKWRATNGTDYDIYQNGRRYTFQARNERLRFTADGGGEVLGRQVTSTYTLHTLKGDVNGTGTFTLSADGNEMTGTFYTPAGATPATVFRKP